MSSTGTNRSARELGPADLVWDHFSRPFDADVTERVYAAAKAGYAGIGVYLGAWASMRDDPAKVEALDAALDETGMVIANIEVVQGWASPDGPNDTVLEAEAIVWDMADRFECRYLQATGPYTGTVAEAATGFGALCDRAADHGLLVGLEWVPEMTNIACAADALEIVMAADRPNGGFCADSWHTTRSTNNMDDIRTLPGEKIFATQLNDGTIKRADPDLDYVSDCLANRVVPGTGEFQLVEFIKALDEIGSVAPIGLEVPGEALWAKPVEEAAQLVYDGMVSVLAKARS